MAMVQLLNDRFDPTSRSIVIEDGTEGNVTLWGNYPPYSIIGGSSSNIVFVFPDGISDVGVDFIVKVPAYVGKSEIRVFIKRYVFAGIEFKVINL